jgi:hypothetical protein
MSYFPTVMELIISDERSSVLRGPVMASVDSDRENDPFIISVLPADNTDLLLTD